MLYLSYKVRQQMIKLVTKGEKNMKQRCNNEKAITLIALVVTVIVLIILGGISIHLILGNNGVITKAEDAKEQHKIAELEERLELDKGPVSIQNRGEVQLSKYIDYIK